MELNFKFNKEMIVEMANRVLDGYEYNGKTIREWADLIANPKTNADRIRAMTDEELAEHLYRWDNSPLHASLERWLGWLKQDIPNDE